MVELLDQQTAENCHRSFVFVESLIESPHSTITLLQFSSICKRNLACATVRKLGCSFESLKLFLQEAKTHCLLKIGQRCCNLIKATLTDTFLHGFITFFKFFVLNLQMVAPIIQESQCSMMH